MKFRKSAKLAVATEPLCGIPVTRELLDIPINWITVPPWTPWAIERLGGGGCKIHTYDPYYSWIEEGEEDHGAP